MRFGDLILFESYSQNRAIEKIEDLLPQTILHMFKCVTMPNSLDLNHWLKEIRNWLVQMDAYSNIKTKSRRISLKVFLEEFQWYFKTKTLGEYLDNIVDEYIDIDCNPKETINYISSILYDLFDSFSRDSYSWAIFEKRLRCYK